MLAKVMKILREKTNFLKTVKTAKFSDLGFQHLVTTLCLH